MLRKILMKEYFKRVILTLFKKELLEKRAFRRLFDHAVRTLKAIITVSKAGLSSI